jgi:hypothetical protein
MSVPLLLLLQETQVDAEMLQHEMPAIVVNDTKEKLDDAGEDAGGVEVVLKQVRSSYLVFACDCVI